MGKCIITRRGGGVNIVVGTIYSVYGNTLTIPELKGKTHFIVSLTNDSLNSTNAIQEHEIMGIYKFDSDLFCTLRWGDSPTTLVTNKIGTYDSATGTITIPSYYFRNQNYVNGLYYKYVAW